MNLPAAYPFTTTPAHKSFTPEAILRLVKQGTIKFPDEPMLPSTATQVQRVKRHGRIKRSQMP